MVRPLRLSFENAFYHITARGNQREKIFYSNLDKKEIPSVRFLSKYDMDTFISKMTRALHIERKMIFDKKRGNLNRSLAIYLIKRFTPCSLSEIGELFKMDYSAVSPGC